jgi:regulator of protease activity HflC (stomatin/prohibitin superfamily)
MGIELIIGIGVGALVLITIISGLRQVRQAEVYIIERLGKYKKTLDSGLNFIMPFLDKPRKILWRYALSETSKGTVYVTTETHKIDLRETVLDSHVKML